MKKLYQIFEIISRRNCGSPAHMQQEIMNFLVHKEKSDLKGDLFFLFDVFNNYKYNWDNDMYKKTTILKFWIYDREQKRKLFSIYKL